MTLSDLLGWVAAGVYGLCMALLVVYALHGAWLLSRFLRRRPAALALEAEELARPLPADADLPVVLVQLPTFNERDVLERVVAAAGRLDWPRERLRIQVLDDSTDDSVDIARAAVAELRARGLNAELRHREDRAGFKAGALEAGMRGSDAEFVAIFDADFVPQPDFLRRAIRPFFADEGLALVQGRWEHLNRDAGALTRVQAIGIDGHFAVEQGARAWSGLAMNFNGTCGLWRRAAIEDAGGWEHDTLTEDLDLSYRAQLRGWRCTYRMGLAVPGELPSTIAAWRSQQFRWAKGSQMTARKLCGRLFASDWPLHHKLASLLHLTHYAVHPLMLASLLAAPIALAWCPRPPLWLLMAGLAAFLIGILSPVLTYAVSQVVLRGREATRTLRWLPALAAIGTGLALSNSRAVLEAWRGVRSPFVRTPKRGSGPGSYRAAASSGIPELFCAGWAALGILVSAWSGRQWLSPLLLIYASGFAWVGYLSCALPRARTRNPSEFLAPLGLLAAGAVAASCYALLGSALPDTWQSQPWRFASLGLVAGACYLAAVRLVRRRPGGGATLALVLFFGLAFRVAASGLAASDDLNRYVTEGVQWDNGQNPYRVAPADPRAQELLAPRVDAALLAAVNHPEWTAIYSPVTVWAEVLITRVEASVSAMKLAYGIFELLAMLLALALVVGAGLPASWILLALWNPVGPIWFAGEGHNDSLMVLLFCAALWLSQRGRERSGSVILALAAMAKPFAALAFLPRWRREGSRALLPLLFVALLAYLPFAGAGAGLFASLGAFGKDLHFHGALEPPVRLLVEASGELFTGERLAGGQVRSIVTVLLLAILASGSWWLLRRPAGADEQPIARTGRLIALLLLCLPTCYPWYMLLLVVCLPFLGHSPGLLVWTAMTPAFWLHGVLILRGGGEWAQWPVAIVLAHAPAVLLLGWEALGRPRPMGRSRGRELVARKV